MYVYIYMCCACKNIKCVFSKRIYSIDVEKKTFDKGLGRWRLGARQNGVLDRHWNDEWGRGEGEGERGKKRKKKCRKNQCRSTQRVHFERTPRIGMLSLKAINFQKLRFVPRSREYRFSHERKKLNNSRVRWIVKKILFSRIIPFESSPFRKSLLLLSIVFVEFLRDGLFVSLRFSSRVLSLFSQRFAIEGNCCSADATAMLRFEMRAQRAMRCYTRRTIRFRSYLEKARGEES